MSRSGLLEAIGSPEFSVHGADGLDRVVRRSVVRLFGSVAGLLYRVDETEAKRRADNGLGALTRLHVLDALMNLPLGAVVPWSGLSPADRQRLAGLPPSAVETSSAGVMRLAVAPAIPEMAVIAVRDWRRGLSEAGQFAPYCARSLLLPKPPVNSELGEAQVRAALYGVGLYAMEQDGVQVLAEPERYIRLRHTAAQWWFAEQVWGQVSGKC